MKCLATGISFLLFVMLPALTFAGWQVAKPGAAIPSEPFFQAGTQQNNAFVPTTHNAAFHNHVAFPNRYASLGRPAALYAISVSGSLKENLERIMDRYHWRVVWKVPYDYNFDGRVTGSSLPDVIEKILQPFPLQARMYMSNRTMTVVSRKP